MDKVPSVGEETMKNVLLLCACVALLGCDYQVPLCQEPSGPRELDLVGAWERDTAPGETESLTIMPLHQREYIALLKNRSASLVARAYPCRMGDQHLMQLQWLGSEKGLIPPGEPAYQIASYTVDGSNLTVRLLNPDVVSADATNSFELIEALAAQTGHPSLFRSPLVYRQRTEE
jgi:hypothetical protein